MQLSKEVIKKRKELHEAIQKKMRLLGLCTSEKSVEAFKRWYLWSCYNVETSRALSLEGLKNAFELLQGITYSGAMNGILKHSKVFSQQSELRKLTKGQRNKIKAIARYSLKITPVSLKKYSDKTLERDVHVTEAYNMDISMTEAHFLIQRLEKWEAKQKVA